MTYTRLAVTPSAPGRRDAVSAALFAAGAEGLVEEGLAFVTVFADDGAARTAERAARAADDAATTACSALMSIDYTSEWRANVRAHTVGGLVIAPPWLAGESDLAKTVVIDPGLGFGTGEHETTRGALALLQDVIRPGDRVADVGCGSAVLAIAAARLGAARVTALEIDAQSIGNAEENVVRNGVGACVTVVEGDATTLLPLVGPVRVIAANIIASVLVSLLPAFDAALAPHGDVVVGGVLRDERDAFARDLASAGWRVVRDLTDGEWWSAHVRRAAE